MLEISCTSESVKSGTVGIVRALSLALCRAFLLTDIHRMSEMTQPAERHGLATSTLDTNAPLRRNDVAGSSESFRYRILILNVTPDASTQYVPMMNCIFCAQKMGIPVDVCHLFDDDTVFLRQACHLTNGHYCSLDTLDGLLQVLMTVYLPSRSIRPQLMFPAEDDVDYRAACFCHRRIVDIGYICSVCLSSTYVADTVFCEPRESCLICRSKFPHGTLQRFDCENKVLSILKNNAH